jgi:hypothetical protein
MAAARAASFQITTRDELLLGNRTVVARTSTCILKHVNVDVGTCIVASHISYTSSALLLSNALQSLSYLLTYHITISMATNTERVLAAATEALQRIGEIERNIVDTLNAPQFLSDLDKQLEAIRARIGALKEVKEEQWRDLQKPLSIHARATLIAITDICEDLDKGIWVKTEDNQLVLRTRVLANEWKGQRIAASQMTLLTLQNSFDLIIGAAHT